MFEMIYAFSTFGIDSQGIFKAFVATRSREREAAKVFCFVTSLHEFDLTEPQRGFDNSIRNPGSQAHTFRESGLDRVNI